MKKEKRWLFGIIALIAVLAFAMTACPGNGPGGTDIVDDDTDNDGDTVENPRFTVSGKFTNGGTTSYFKAQESAGNAAASFQRSAFRAASDNEVPLAGTLDDGDITFRLKGFYDAESGAYTLQAASSYIKYSINGTAEGKTSASIATRGSASEPFGTPTYVQVTTEVTGADLAAGMTSTKQADLVEGFTKNDAWGVWYDERSNAMSGEFKYVVNEWGITLMVKNQAGEWEEGETLGFSKIIEKNDNSIDVIGDVTWTEYFSEDVNEEEFQAYLANKGYQLFDQNKTPFPGQYGNFDIFNNPAFSTFFDGYEQSGALVTGPGSGDPRFLVYIYYEPDGQLYGKGTQAKPFVVYQILQEGIEGPALVSSDEDASAITAPTLKAACDLALSLIKSKTGVTGTYNPALPFTYSNSGVTMSLAIAAWEKNNPRPTAPDNFTESERQEWERNHWEEISAWSIRYDTKFKELLLANFHTNFPNADKLLVLWSTEYTDLRMEYSIEMNLENVEYSTKYYKWNVVEENDKLKITPYTSGGTLETVYVDTYEQAEANSTLVGNETITLTRSLE